MLGGDPEIPKVGAKTDEVGGPLGHQKSPAQRMPTLLSSHKPRTHEDRGTSRVRLGETQRGSEDKGH